MTLLSGFELKEFNSGSLTGAYQNLGSALANPAYYAHIYNNSSEDIYISTDGSTNDIMVLSGQILPLTFYSRHNTLIRGSCLFPKGQQLYIKQVIVPLEKVALPPAPDIIVNILTKR